MRSRRLHSGDSRHIGGIETSISFLRMGGTVILDQRL